MLGLADSEQHQLLLSRDVGVTAAVESRTLGLPGVKTTPMGDKDRLQCVESVCLSVSTPERVGSRDSAHDNLIYST